MSTISPLRKATLSKATLLGRLFEKHGVKLTRAEQLNGVAYLEGFLSWHVLSAHLKAEESPSRSIFNVTAHTSMGDETWRVEVAHLDHEGQNLALAASQQVEPSDELQLQLTQHLAKLNELFDPEFTLVAMVNGQLGLLVEQEFESFETDAPGCQELTLDCVGRLSRNLLPQLGLALAGWPLARAAVVTDSKLCWSGRPTCFVFLPLAQATSAQVDTVRKILLDFAYPVQVN